MDPQAEPDAWFSFAPDWLCAPRPGPEPLGSLTGHTLRQTPP